MTIKTAADFREDAGRHLEAREESFARCDTDGFVSQHCHGLNAREAEARATITENGGTAEFRGLFRREDGARIAAKLICGKFGYCWAFCDEDGKFTGRFLSDSKGTKRSKMYREGFEVRMEKATAWAKVDAPAGSTGLGGLASCYIATYRTDGGFPATATVL